MTVTDPAHVEIAHQLREQFTRPRTFDDTTLIATSPTTTALSASTERSAVAQTARRAADAVRQIHYLAAALKAPRIVEAAARLADQARDAGWTHEDYLAAVLEREVSARNASGAEQRIRFAGFPARKTLDDFDWDHQPAVRQQIAALASGAFLTEARNVVLLGPSNLPFSNWGGVFGDQAVAAAMIDRIVHHADVLTMKGASYRLRNRGIDTLPSIRTDADEPDA
jgi:hypothetical protein